MVDTGDVLVFLGERFALTVRHGATGALAPVREEAQRRPEVLAQVGSEVAVSSVCST
ncbi:hypothetical protein [Micromonospora sp. NPDC049282]|uniref:hypothetical protein n=1 Tax=Micromonospora sp. NPDC049282 TaxID=3364269 RepID=UPI0037169043